MSTKTTDSLNPCFKGSDTFIALPIQLQSIALAVGLLPVVFPAELNDASCFLWSLEAMHLDDWIVWMLYYDLQTSEIPLSWVFWLNSDHCWKFTEMQDAEHPSVRIKMPDATYKANVDHVFKSDLLYFPNYTKLLTNFLGVIKILTSFIKT